jgi:hypothetical protein
MDDCQGWRKCSKQAGTCAACRNLEHRNVGNERNQQTTPFVERQFKDFSKYAIYPSFEGCGIPVRFGNVFTALIDLKRIQNWQWGGI